MELPVAETLKSKPECGGYRSNTITKAMPREIEHNDVTTGETGTEGGATVTIIPHSPTVTRPIGQEGRHRALAAWALGLDTIQMAHVVGL
jgi:hypothetical protein